MEIINPQLSTEYNKWVGAFNADESLSNICVINAVDVLDAYFSMVDFYIENNQAVDEIGYIGPKNKEILLSAVARQIDGTPNNLKWKNEYEKCATLFYGLIINQPFQIFNNRTALLTALYYLSKIDRVPTGCHKELEIITRIIASNEIRNRKAFKPYSKFEDGEIRFLAAYFKENTRPIESKDFLITYSKINELLSEFGLCLTNPHGNSIDIVLNEKRLWLLKTFKKWERHTKIDTIEFPGWTRGVPEKEIGLFKEYAGLTGENSFDAQAACKGDLPLSSLINNFSACFSEFLEADCD